MASASSLRLRLRLYRHVEVAGRSQGVRQATTGDRGRHRVSRSRHVHHGRVAGVLADGDGHAVRGQPDTVYRGRAAYQACEHVLLDHVHFHHAGRVPPGTGLGGRAPRRRPRERRAAQILHLLPVGVLRTVLPGHDVLFPQVAVGHARGRTHVYTGHGTALRAGIRGREGETEKDTRPLHVDSHQG